jgi:hypothetical protein
MSDILSDLSKAVNEEGVQDIKLEEEVEESKLDFQRVTNELKTATQEAKAISVKTIASYRRYLLLLLSNLLISTSLWNKFEQYIVSNLGSEAKMGLDPPCKDVPIWISSWIFTVYDIPDPNSGSRSYCQNKTYSHALKMMASNN